ncbi:hypothetical protein DFJ43DRAFT_554766 [Lentinula guzmanii]|uniref:Uncharacterized protein n=1 Tax=Lentinula guzmanii TaxID=2804957 RepID=A0AA38JMQ3_9AGAR|nr:hypothetical protein DFJ43DRAFT_554766 [Lentinula guzmanii]
MHLNPAYLLFALLSPVAYAAPTTAEISNIPIRGKPLVNERKHKLVPEPVDLNTNTKKIKLEEEGEKMDVNEQTHDLTPKHDNTVHVKISGRPHRTYQTFTLDQEYEVVQTGKGGEEDIGRYARPARIAQAAEHRD